MPTLIKDQTIDEFLQYSLNANDIFILARSGSIYSTVGGFISAAGPEAVNLRLTFDSEAFFANFGQLIYTYGGDIVDIGENGRLILGSRNEYAGISLGHGSGQTRLTNQGEITVANGTGVEVLGGFNSILNTGTIAAGSNGVLLGQGGGSNDVLTNTGLIAVNRANAFGDYYGYGVQASGQNFRIDNSGTILTSAASTDNVGPPELAAAIIVQDGAAGGVITNSGALQASGGFGIRVDNLAGGTVRVENTGTIQGGRGSFLSMGDADDQVVNRGQMTGSVTLGDGDDLFDNLGGRVVGEVNGGLGNDTYRLDGAMTLIDSGGTDLVESAITWVLAEGFENLTLLGGGDTRGQGNSGENILTGGAGDNGILGLGGADRLLGRSGDDTLSGGGEGDSLNGQDGDDLLSGGTGDDSLFGGAGRDTLTGGAGGDRLSGGEEADLFVWQSPGHAPTLAGGTDLVTDFAVGEDLLDLSAIDAIVGNANSADAFTFIGSAAHSAGTAGTLRFAFNASTTTVTADLNGDGVADMTIRLSGPFALTVNDFVL